MAHSGLILQRSAATAPRVAVLAGGIGAARFLEGLVQVVPPEQITVIVNTGDDFTLHGLHISPDLDIVTCTLAGVINPQQGWGIADDTYAALAWLGRLGGPTWFNLGDRDLALHIRRTALLRAGTALHTIADEFRRALGVVPTIVPMCNEPVPTYIDTTAGAFHFEEYLVQRKARDTITGVRFVGVEQAQPAPGVLDALANADVVLVAPSNPVVSIGPILAVPGVRATLQARTRPVIAISPIVGGVAIKGPAVPLLQATGTEVSPVGVARLYHDFLDVLVIDQQDADLRASVATTGVQAVVTDTIMRGLSEKIALAQTALAAQELCP